MLRNTAIGCDESGWRRVLGVSVAGTESYESWIGFLQAPRDRGATGCVSSRGFEQKDHRKLSSLSIGSAHAF